MSHVKAVRITQLAQRPCKLRGGGEGKGTILLTIWSRSGCHGQWSKILTMTMAKISASNHGQMVKISTMTTDKIQIFHGQNGQPKILP